MQPKSKSTPKESACEHVANQLTYIILHSTDSEDVGKGPSTPGTDNSGREAEGSMTNPEDDNFRGMELEDTTEEPDIDTSSEDHPGRVRSRASMSSARSSKESREEKAGGSPEPESDITTSEGLTELSSQKTPETPLSSTARSKGFPKILGGVRRESTSEYQVNREALDTVAADTHQKPLGISVSMQTDASWLYDHVYKRKYIYAVLSQDLSCLDILCDMEFKEDFLKLFQESLRTLSSVGPPTILAYRPESSREDIHIEFEKYYPSNCEFCGSPLRIFPSFESLEQIAEYGYLFCCQQCRDLHEFIVNEKKLYVKTDIELINISPHKAHGTEAERQQAKERARQRQQERQMAKQIAFIKTEEEREIVPVHSPEYNKQLTTISFSLSEERTSLAGWARIPLQLDEEVPLGQDITYSISCCDFTIAGGKLVKNQFLQQYYKNGVKFLTMFPDGTAQIFYPSGNLAIIVVKKKQAGYICIVQEDKPENAEIQAVFESCGKGTCYHSNGIVWINITIQGGHYSDEAGNKVKTWIWPNNLQKRNPSSVLFKPVFLALNLNVGVRILGQDKIAISFLAMGKQAKINVGTKVKPLADHHPWPKHVSQDDLLLFASRIKILRIFAKLHGCLDFPTNDWWTKLQLPSYLLKRAVKLIYLCKECEISSVLDKLITEIVNSPA
ncbi:glutamate-rich protein 6 [Elgaria multicarinata webbii]|uniref:glutamate-rich protein 6 n=1 Tax=Elgaria multicarinata webbii TaxID=159646 RepID=UPI002FCCD96F